MSPRFNLMSWINKGCSGIVCTGLLAHYTCRLPPPLSNVINFSRPYEDVSQMDKTSQMDSFLTIVHK